jgi:hypothetical protein
MATAMFAVTADNIQLSTLLTPESRSYTLNSSRENLRTRADTVDTYQRVHTASQPRRTTWTSYSYYQSKNSKHISRADLLPNLGRKVIRIMVQGLCYVNIGCQDVKKKK